MLAAGRRPPARSADEDGTASSGDQLSAAPRGAINVIAGRAPHELGDLAADGRHQMSAERRGILKKEFHFPLCVA
jgi:hypothetical protein